MYQQRTKKDASFSYWFHFYSPVSPTEGRSWATQHQHIGSRIAKVSFLLRWSPGGHRIRLSCSGFHILSLSKLNQEHISSRRPPQKPAIPFWQAVPEMELLETLKACLSQPSVLAGPAATTGGPGSAGGAARPGGKFHPRGSQMDSCQRFLSFAQ